MSIGEEEESRRIPTLPLGWTTSLTLTASVIDLKDGREVGPIVAGGEGDRACAVSFSLAPFSCSVETVREPVCQTLGERLGNYVAGKAPAAAPYEDASAAHDRGDYATALRLVRPLAAQGHAAAQNNLGIMYVYGQGVPQDDAEAIKWFRKAAAQGHAPAQNNLGIMYRNGQGVPQDYVQAYVWFNLAAARFSPSETEKREKALSDREEVAAKMTSEQIAEARRLAQEWKPK